MEGVVTLNKQRGMTSHDVVAAVRRILKEKRIGHTGTLDPMATGVLVLCVGKATRIAQYIEAGEKEYHAVMRLGIETDTLDAQGKIVRSCEFDPPSAEKLVELMSRFTGPLMQQPPVYSALKVAGVPSYKLAREGNPKPLAPRSVHIKSITLTTYDCPLVGFTVTCSKGVYIRSLCADMGKALGMGAHLTSLIRTRSGNFTLQNAKTLDQLADCVAEGNSEALMTIDHALGEFPAIRLKEKDSIRILHGNRVNFPEEAANLCAGRVRLLDESGRLLALANCAEGTLKPEIVFS